MSFKSRLKKKVTSKDSFYFNDFNSVEQENFLLEASKVPVYPDFHSNSKFMSKTFLKHENRSEEPNIIQKNISTLKNLSEKVKKFKKIQEDCSITKEKMILPSILPEFKIKNNHIDRKKKRQPTNYSLHIKNNQNKESLKDEVYSKEIDLYNFLSENHKSLVKNEKTVGNLVRYSTLFDKKQKNYKKFYIA